MVPVSRFRYEEHDLTGILPATWAANLCFIAGRRATERSLTPTSVTSREAPYVRSRPLLLVDGETGESDHQSRGDQTGTDTEDVMGPYCDTATSGASCDRSGLSRYAAPDKAKCP